MTAKDIMKLLQKEGWYVSEIRGSHQESSKNFSF
jgi:predicted RNA binding protein YcfA (HicA-like mRNA interferase family)